MEARLEGRARCARECGYRLKAASAGLFATLFGAMMSIAGAALYDTLSESDRNSLFWGGIGVAAAGTFTLFYKFYRPKNLNLLMSFEVNVYL